MVATLVRMTARDGEEDELESALRESRRRTRVESGNQVYDIWRSSQDVRVFVVYEVYEDESARRKHRGSDYVKRLVLRIRGMCVELELSEYDEVA